MHKCIAPLFFTHVILNLFQDPSGQLIAMLKSLAHEMPKQVRHDLKPLPASVKKR